MVKNRKGFVYLIWCESGHHKIGRTRKSVQARLASMRTGCPLALKLIHVIECDDCEDVENLLHRHFAAKRISGEWFTLDMFEVNWLKNFSVCNLDSPIVLPDTWETHASKIVEDAEMFHESLEIASSERWF